MAEATTDTVKRSPSINGDLDDVEMSLQGMTMLLNNEWEEAAHLFKQHKDTSPLMCAGYSMYIFMQALMSFEEEKLSEAMKALQETEKFCDTNSNIFKSRRKKTKHNAHRLEEKYERQILVADSVLYQAMLTFVQQDLTGYVKGGWLLRKAWKHYHKLQRDITALHEKTKPRNLAKDLPEAEQSAMTTSPSNGSLKRSEESLDQIAAIGEMTEDVSARLLGAVSFGFGTFQLCLSLIPPRVLKIIEFLGFEGDRQVGLQALDVASRSRDMKAPLATLGLVWYHTVIRPFFALDGQNWSAGIADGKAVLERGQAAYPKSALFLFFRARIYRLQSQVDEALATYNIALEACASQRETQLICHHEIGWIQMMCMNWKEAYEGFHKLKTESRWSKSFYCYLSACTLGAMDDVEGAHKEMLEVPLLVRRKNNQIEQFVLRRAERFKKEKPTREHATLLLFEVLYLWNAIPTCRRQDIEKMVSECNNINDRKLFHLRSLIEGALYNELENPEMAQTCLEEAIARHQGLKCDYHVPAFAAYEIGMMLAKHPQTFAQAKKFLEQAKEQHKEFDFDGRLHVRVNAALKRIQSEGTPI